MGNADKTQTERHAPIMREWPESMLDVEDTTRVVKTQIRMD